MLGSDYNSVCKTIDMQWTAIIIPGHLDEHAQAIGRGKDFLLIAIPVSLVIHALLAVFLVFNWRFPESDLTSALTPTVIRIGLLALLFHPLYSS
jgi:hypothetical protein